MGSNDRPGRDYLPRKVASRIALVGPPNVGKSALFNALTGARVTVSNYPGTTVEVYRGRAYLDGCYYEVVDTPGIYSLLPVSEEEYVTRRLLKREEISFILQVVEAKNLGRSLPLTFQLLETGLPVILVLNLLDEARAAGLVIDQELLSRELGIPVVATVAVRGEGLNELINAIKAVHRLSGPSAPRLPRYEPAIEEALAAIEAALTGNYGFSRRAMALILLQGDTEIEAEVAASGDNIALRLAEDWRRVFGPELPVRIATCRAAEARRLDALVTTGGEQRDEWRTRLAGLLIHPILALPFLAAVLYFGLYLFVGVFGAGTIVHWLEEVILGRYVNPLVEGLTSRIPYGAIRELLGGEYGLFTLALRYAVAIVLPIVGMFFLTFAVLEDSGYLPRLAYLLDRTCKRLGLSGRAVIPLVLGFGCDTMATMVTRTLETRRERLIATFLLALAVPCSAQLGVIMGLLAHRPLALGLWVGSVALIFTLAGYLAKRIIPGEETSFYIELPPLRWPRLRNVFVKTVTRMKWYFFEIVPLFALASVLIWVGRLTGLFETALALLRPVVKALGLPPEVARVFLFGFFRRDYGAAGLHDLAQAGRLDGNQLVISAVTMTLFVPCIAQFLIMAKERGLKTALGMAGIIFPFSFLVGYTFHRILTLLGVHIS